MVNRLLLVVGCAIALKPVVHPCSAQNRIRNYGHTIRVNSITADSKAFWIGTSGGLVRMDKESRKQDIFSNANHYPDLHITSVCIDGEGSLWIGTERGYLYKRTQSGLHQVFPTYASAGWSIRHLTSRGDYLIVSSNRGCSIFDKKRGLALKNAQRFGSFRSSSVNMSFVYKDTLFLGSDDGIALLNITGNRLFSENFYDHTIWTTRNTALPIVSFVEYNGQLQGVPYLAGRLGKSDVHIESSHVFLDRVRKTELPSAARCLLTGDGLCLIGTTENYLYAWNGTDNPVQISIPGLTLGSVNRVLADRSGSVWVTFGGDCESWWCGIGRFHNGEWVLYNSQTPGFGWLGHGAVHGIGEQTKFGNNVWFGTHGGNVKSYSHATREWTRYYVSGMNAYGGFRKFGRDEEEAWGKSDAIAQDSTGYMWIGSWNNFSGFLICYDPDEKDGGFKYRRFFPAESPLYSNEITITKLHVDPANWIFAGTNKGELLVFRHDGQPITNGIGDVLQRPGFVAVYDMASTSNGKNWIVGGNGLTMHQYTGGSHTFTLLDTLSIPEITCVEPDMNNILWLGTASRGVARVNTDTWATDWVNEMSGLASNRVQDLSLDLRTGNLWIATDRGVSRYDLGYSAQGDQVKSVGRVYPNPLKKSQHTHVLFSGLGVGSRITIYDRGGRIVDKIASRMENNMQKAMTWVPNRLITPGTYFYVVESKGSPPQKGSLLIVP